VSLAAVLVWSIVRTILRSPDIFAMFLSHRRGVRGYLAISRGLVAVGAGDAHRALVLVRAAREERGDATARGPHFAPVEGGRAADEPGQQRQDGHRGPGAPAGCGAHRIDYPDAGSPQGTPTIGR